MESDENGEPTLPSHNTRPPFSRQFRAVWALHADTFQYSPVSLTSKRRMTYANNVFPEPFGPHISVTLPWPRPSFVPLLEASLLPLSARSSVLTPVRNERVTSVFKLRSTSDADCVGRRSVIGLLSINHVSALACEEERTRRRRDVDLRGKRVRRCGCHDGVALRSPHISACDCFTPCR